MKEIMEKSLSDSDLISPEEMLGLLGKRMNPEYEKNQMLYDRKVHLLRKYENIQLTVFEGRHEQISQALSLLPYNHTVTDLKCNILAIGDSNGQNKGGWVDQLKKMMPESNIVNLSESGRTIGFDNNGRERLNALKNIDAYLDKAQVEKKRYDYIIVCLGTNDSKKMFDSRQREVSENLKVLLAKIKKHKLCRSGKTKFIYVTPPPLRDENVSPKYQDSGKRLARLVPELETMALKQGFDVVNIHQPLLGVLDYYAKDGVHMAEPGQEIVASKILSHILSKR